MQQSLIIAKQIDARKRESISEFNLGNSWRKLGQKLEAKTAYENAKKLYRAMRLDQNVEDCEKAIQDLETDNVN